MPLYEFYCSDCAEPFTVLCGYEQRTNVSVCAKCGGKAVKPALSVFAVHGGGGSGRQSMGAPEATSQGGGGCCGGSCGCGAN